MKFLLIDCEDSFTLNIADSIRQCNVIVDVILHNEIKIHKAADYQAIILSPGPNQPQDIPVLETIISKYKAKIPILGICLGHQAIGLHYGHQLVKSPNPLHGIPTKIIFGQSHDILENIEHKTFEAMRYNSLAIAHSSNSELKILCTDENGEIMGLYHNELPIFSFQFHPESIGTPQGQLLIKNWIKCLSSFWDKKPK